MVAYVGGYGGARSSTEVFKASFFTSTDASNVEEVVLDLGNKLARECRYFDYKNLQVIETLIDTATVCMSPLRKVARNLFNICRNKKSRPSIDKLKLCLPFLKALLVSEDKEVLVNVCWVLSEISGVSNDHIQLVVEGEVIARLIELLKVDDTDIILPALHCIGNIVTGTDFQTDRVVGEGVQEVLASLLNRLSRNLALKMTVPFIGPSPS
ncbi:importin subunit alpha-like [Artemia franciscana]|uniref:importin subunit alpha-like n=1 Tax=Artemia franciscana TaxID=6661 RepID=UPI0032DACFC6